jgi:hypothetical protein
MRLLAIPLGNGSFADLQYTSPNNYGVDIPFFTDAWTGADPFRSAIPNPPVVHEWPDNWGAAPDLLPYVPARPIQQCCTVVTPRDEVPESVPEPASFLLVAAVLVAGLMRRRFAR